MPRARSPFPIAWIPRAPDPGRGCGYTPAMRRRRTPAQHAAIPGASAPSRQGDVLLAWARDRDGRKVHARKLAPADRRTRAPFTCLGCGEDLVPHLGQVRARHFSHAAGSRCPLTAPETALHLDGKERLLLLCTEAFAGVRTVSVLARCPACRRARPFSLADAGDAARGEGAVGPLRADVLVSRGGAPALAIEVKVTHAVEPEKEAALAAAGVPAVEIDAREEWERDGDGVTEIVCHRSLGFPPCPACAAGTRADLDRAKGGEAAEIAELEAYRARGLLGPMPRARGGPAPDAPGPGSDAPLGADERAELAGRFRCPECGGAQIAFGDRIARHPCPEKGDRPVAWRGYDGVLVQLSWWRREPGRGGGGA
jgi:hypothetical protein